MFFDEKNLKVYCIKTEKDAQNWWNKSGAVNFAGGDQHGLDNALGGRISSTLQKTL
jgi:hypothetical protein